MSQFTAEDLDFQPNPADDHELFLEALMQDIAKLDDEGLLAVRVRIDSMIQNRHQTAPAVSNADVDTVIGTETPF